MKQVTLALMMAAVICTAAQGANPEWTFSGNQASSYEAFVSSNLYVEQTFQPDAAVGKDAYIASAMSSTNFGDEIDLAVALVPVPLIRFRSLIQFTELDNPQYENATVISAALELYKYSNEAGVLSLHTLDSDWTESSATWNNCPAYSGNQEVTCPSGDTWISIDVTDYVQEWVNNSQENHGFLLRESLGYIIFNFYSSDYNAAPELRPKLVLNYIPYSALGRCTWARIKGSW